MILPWLTLVLVAAVVLVLAGYLIAIAWELNEARKNVRQLADGMEAIAGHTTPLEEKVLAIDGALETMEAGFAEVNDNLAEAAGAFGR